MVTAGQFEEFSKIIWSYATIKEAIFNIEVYNSGELNRKHLTKLSHTKQTPFRPAKEKIAHFVKMGNTASVQITATDKNPFEKGFIF